MPDDGDRNGEVQSVRRAISVLEFLSRERSSGVTGVANELNVHKSTAYRLLATLKTGGLVEQEAKTERYRLGPGLVVLARAVTEDLDVVHASRPVTQRLSVQTRETVTISVLAGEDVVVIDQTNAMPSVLNAAWTGKHFPLHCTSDGKVLLAHLSERHRNELLNRSWERYTDSTVTDPAVLRQQLDTVRQRGYGYSVEELEMGLVGVAAPIAVAGGKVIASISVSGPSFRLSVESIPRLGGHTKRAAAEISRKLGFRSTAAPTSSLQQDPA
ncbi:MAG: IclR family transcriptional regulator [Chloroflexota bacterium]|nr:MAG: IclR family transcriptional regulator [Chloroflexota bacterium]